MKKNRFWYLLLPTLTLILEILPYGAVMRFANPHGAPQQETYSYFDLLPFGYANFAPLLTAILTCIIFALLFIYLIIGKNSIAVFAKRLTGICIILSLGPLVLGTEYFSMIGGIITACLAIEWLTLHFSLQKQSQKERTL